MKKKADENEKRRLGRRAAAIAAGTAAAAAITIGSMFNSADELMNDDPEEDQPVTEAVAVATKQAAAQPQKPADTLRAFFLRQNTAVRGLVLLPLWAVGKAILSVISLLWAAVAPYWSILLGVLLNAALLVALFWLVYKTIFPEARLKDLFKKKRWLWLLGGTLLIAAIDAVLKLSWTDYQPISIIVKLVCGFVILTILSFRLFGRKKATAAHAA